MEQLRENRVKRLKYQSFYRGCKETDIILSKFAKRYLDSFNDLELDQFENLMNEDDRDIFNWVTGNEKVPEEKNNKIIKLLLEFNYSE